MKIFRFFKENISSIFLALIIIFFFATGRFNILKNRIDAFLCKDQGKVVSYIRFIDLETNHEVSFTKLKNKIVLINFWATWFPPCRFELKMCIKLKRHCNSCLKIYEL